jgi:hypothetical protein
MREWGNWRTTLVSGELIFVAAVKVAPTTSLPLWRSRKTARSLRALKFLHPVARATFLSAPGSRVRRPPLIKRKNNSRQMKCSAPLFIKIAALKLNSLDRHLSLWSLSLTLFGLSLSSNKKGYPSGPLSPSSVKNGSPLERTLTSLKGIVKVWRRKGHALSCGRRQIIALKTMSSSSK